MADRLAIDVGGTFTDVVLLDTTRGKIRFEKVLSTPADPSLGSLEGARSILDHHGVAPSDVGELVHATTVATNAVLERKGAVTGLLTTRGFRDALEMGRESRYDIYDFGLTKPQPLVPRRLRVEVDERMGAEGQVILPLDEAQAIEALHGLVRDGGIQSLAICLLHGYAYPQHELRLAELVRQHYPDLQVSVSHQVAGEIREFERCSTTVVDAYVKPLVRRYIGRLNEEFSRLGFRREVSMMLSHGGIGPSREVADNFPVRMIESGPAAGAIAAAYFAAQALERPDAIAFDMGGTTAKISLIQNGQPTIANEYEVGHVHRFKRGSGLPLQIAAIELLEIGAGGGSIAQVNELGLLTVGPHSSGAAPGPACYGRGGKAPTVTDADLLLGYLDPEHFLGGDMKLDVAAARAAMMADIGPRLGFSADSVAWGIHNIVNERMAAATRAHIVEKGVDVRAFSLIAFGGAGPVHAYALARKLGVQRVICPFGAGVASSIGCLVAVPGIELVTAYMASFDDLDWTGVANHYERMREQAQRVLASLIGSGKPPQLRASMEMRCQGQGYSVTIPLPDNAPIGPALRANVIERFAAVYVQLYGHRPPDVPLEIVNLRARVEQAGASLDLKLDAETVARDPLKGRRQVYFEAAGGFVSSAVYDRYALPVGQRFSGPAIVEERETSTAIGPDAVFHRDGAAHLVIEFPQASQGTT